MRFCTSCGTQIAPDSKFCSKCGAKQPDFVAPPPQAQPPVAPTPANYTNTVEANTSMFAGLKVRFRCPNGHVFDGTNATGTCPTCGAVLPPKEGIIQLYRMGNYLGCAVGMGIYIDGVSYGLVANKESVRISLPYGPHKVHVTHTTTRKCNDPVFTLSPDYPVIYTKAHFAAAGFKIVVEQATENEMPN